MNSWIRRPYTGLALGGGGARGLAHIGVLKVLEAENIPIDCLVGSSMGGLIAALYAVGLSPQKLEAEAQNFSKLSQMFKLIDFSPPNRGLIKADRLRHYLANLIGGDTRIEKLSKPLALTAVDLKTRKLVTLSRGSLIDAILATSSVPGLFPPVEFDQYLLVDGGVLNNVPADIPRKMGAETVFAVDVNFISDEKSQWEYITSSSPLNKILPSFAIDFYQAEFIMVSAITEANLKKAKPDILIRPLIPAEINVFLGFSHAVQAIKLGENATYDHITKINELIKPRFRIPIPAPNIDHLYSVN